MAAHAPQVTLTEWHALGSHQRDAVRALEISAEQIEYAGTLDNSVASCEAGDPAEVAGLAICSGTAIVGWVALKRRAAAPAGPATTPRWSADCASTARQQGRGFGAAALAEMARWVLQHWPETTQLTLRVDDDNAAAVRAYEKAGWTEAGERRVGRVGVERTMSFKL